MESIFTTFLNLLYCASHIDVITEHPSVPIPMQLSRSNAISFNLSITILPNNSH